MAYNEDLIETEQCCSSTVRERVANLLAKVRPFSG